MNEADSQAARHSPMADGVLWSTLSEAQTDAAYAEAWLTLLCMHLERPLVAVVVMGEPDVGPFSPIAIYPGDAQPGEILAEVADRAIAARDVAVASGTGSFAVACPLFLENHLYGMVAVESGFIDAGPAGLLRQLRWGMGGLEARIARQQGEESTAGQERLVKVLNVLSTALSEPGFEAAANAVVTDLALRLDCDRVSLGFRRNRASDVVAISHTASFGERMNLLAAIAAAMDEAIDQNVTLCFPANDDAVRVTRDHAALARQHGSTSVLTVPFRIDEKTEGAWTFERPGGVVFDAETIELCEGIVALVSRALATRRDNERGLRKRVTDVARIEAEKLVGPKHFVAKVVLACVVLFVLFCIFVTGEYRVGAPASVEGAVRRVLVAPYDGYLDSAPHRAGDIVKKDEVIATLDQRDFKLEYLKAASMNEQYAQQAQEALAQHDRAQAGIAMAQAQQARAEMDLRGDQIARASLVAPFDGIVVSGDFSQALGSAVKRGQTLFEVSPLNAYRVILEVDESEIDGVKEGESGELVLASLPGESFPLRISQVTPVTSFKDAHNSFRVEATLLRTVPALRPGMDGLAKIDVGRRRQIWIWTHRLVDWVRLTTWSWI